MQPVNIIGAGLAGSEAAWQLVSRGIPVRLYEMRPVKSPAAFSTDGFAELVCSNYPECKYTENDDDSLNELAKEEKLCPNCGSQMIIKKGRFGPFWACPNYPECKTIISLKQKAAPKKTGEICPECGGELVERMSRYGKPFVGCSNYPKCHYIKKEPKAEKPAAKEAEHAAG